MIRNRLTFTGTFCILLCGLLFASCDHKDLCYAHFHTTKIEVKYDWSEEPEASPEGMCAFFYPVGQSETSQRFDFPGAKGGEIEIAQGKYVLITYNNDTETVQFSSTKSFDDHKAFTREGDILEPMYGNSVKSSLGGENGERVVITPDSLWGCTATDIDITEHGVKYTIVHHHSRADGGTVSTDENGDQIITLTPRDMLCHYSYEVRNVSNAQHISKVSGALSGMSGSMKLSDGSLDKEPVTLPVPGKVNAEANTITGEFLTFGNNPDNNAPNKMSFYVVMDDGKKYSFKDADNLDVTTQVITAPDQRHVHIVIDGLPIPSSTQVSEGYKSTVDDWDVVEEDINI